MNNKLDKVFEKYPKYEKSLHTCKNLSVYMTDCGEEDFLIIYEAPKKILLPIGRNKSSLKNMSSLFEGESEKIGDLEIVKAPLSEKNAVALRKVFPFCAPQNVLKKKCTVGVGDRLGVATDGHLRVFNHYDAIPVLAQQSIRELTLTNRTFSDVLNSATFSVFRNDFQKGFGADGDHLKTFEQIGYAISSGFTMITLDCSDFIVDISKISSEEYDKLSQQKAVGDYTADNGLVTFTDKQISDAKVVYCKAVDYICSVYEKYIKNSSVDFEISIDETAVPTTPAEHYFVANELTLRNVKFDTVAPRFCGEFQKGIDYIGNLDDFRAELVVHQKIADKFGYKLSIHSGSDKLSVFPIIGEVTKGHFHLKTAGTNWLEAVKLVATYNPKLYRELHAFALSVFSQATAYYHVTTNLNNIPDVNTLEDSQLPELFNNNDCRQLIHITYGLILQTKDDKGEYLFRNKLYDFWRTHRNEYSDYIFAHIGNHLKLLGR